MYIVKAGSAALTPEGTTMNDDVTLLPALEAAPDTTSLPTFLTLPGLGQLAINAFLVRAQQPLLLDTGIAVLKERFVDALARVLPLEELAWIYLSHADPDHTGALTSLLERAPKARVVTTYLGMGKLLLTTPLPPERVFLLNPGQRLPLGDRELVVMRPPTFDAPETTALFDTKTRVLFSADAFGALLPGPYDDARAVPAETLREGMLTWASIDAPWLSLLRPEALERSLSQVRELSPSAVLSSHLPPARNMTDVLLSNLDAARAVPPFVGPDQESMMRIMSAAGAPGGGSSQARPSDGDATAGQRA